MLRIECAQLRLQLSRARSTLQIWYPERLIDLGLGSLLLFAWLRSILFPLNNFPTDRIGSVPTARQQIPRRQHSFAALLVDLCSRKQPLLGD